MTLEFMEDRVVTELVGLDQEEIGPRLHDTDTFGLRSFVLTTLVVVGSDTLNSLNCHFDDLNL